MLNRGKSAGALLRLPLPVSDVTKATLIVQVTGESKAVAAGVAGTTGTIISAYAPIASLLGDRVGKFGDSSVSIASGTNLTTEVSFETVANRWATANQGVNIDDPAQDYTSVLTNGEFYIVYETGIFFYKKAAGDTTNTITYKYRSTSSSGGNGDISTVGGVAAPTAGADAVSNTRTDLPTSSRISGFNGTTWDRIRTGITAINSTFTGWLNTLPRAIYNSAPTARTNGQGGTLEADSAGNLRGAEQLQPSAEDNTHGTIATNHKPQSAPTYCNSISHSVALVASVAAKASAGNIVSVVGRLDSTAPSGTYYVHILDYTALPGNGAVNQIAAPLKIQHIGGIDDNFTIGFGAEGTPCSIGIVVALSTTEFTLTISSAYLSLNVDYI